METENTNNMPGKHEPQAIANIYPGQAGQRPGNVPTSSDAAALEVKPYKIPWLKIALLGFFTPLALSLLWGLVLSSGFENLFNIAIALRGLDHLLIIFYVAAIFLTYLVLKRWGLRFPLVIASSSVTFLYGVYTLGTKLPFTSKLGAHLAGYEQTTIQRWALIISPFVFLLAGTFIFVLATYLTNKLRFKSIGIALLLVIVAGLYLGTYVYKAPPSILESLPKVQDVSWKLLPTNLPPWLKEHGQSNSPSCSEQQARSAWYICLYSFVNYPGYLTANSQATITQAQKQISGADPNSYFEPYPFFWVQVIHDDKLLDAYKYKDAACDWNGLLDAGTEPRRRDGSVIASSLPLPKPERCVSVKTPGGKTLYYESFLNYPKDIVQVPVNFYFEQSGSIALIGVDYPNSIDSKTVPSVYLTDPNFQTELYKFVDSFQ